MRIEQTGTGKDVSEAYANAKALLGAPEDAEIFQEIISQGKKKMFGLKTEPAQVKVWYEVPDPVKPAEPAKPVVKTVPEKAPEKKAAPAPVKEAPKAEIKAETKKETAPAAEEAPAEEAVAEKKQLEIAADDRTANYIRSIVEGIGIGEYTLTLELDEAEKEYIYTVSSAEDGVLIGRKGETLDAIQYLVRLFVNKGVAEEKHRKVTVNAGNYREKRRETLIALARKNARQVRKYGRSVTLEPMNPYERRIIHTAIQAVEGVTSESTGFDDNRRVVISLEEGVEPLNPSKGGYNNRGGRGGYNNRGGNRGGRGGRDGYHKKEAYQPSTTRAPRKDSAGSLYGRIEVPGDK